MTGIQQAAMNRADLPKDERSPFFVYADKYTTCVNESFADTLPLARKYGLYLTAAQQIIDQVDETIIVRHVWKLFDNCLFPGCPRRCRTDG